MRNRYAGRCGCGAPVPPSAGYTQKVGPYRWIVRCMPCVVAGKVEVGKPLSLAQHQYRSQSI